MNNEQNKQTNKMNHITHTEAFNNLLNATNEYWKLCTSKDLTDAYTLAAQELHAATNCDSVLTVAETHDQQILDLAIDHLQYGHHWVTSPVSTLIGVLVDAIMETIDHIND